MSIFVYGDIEMNYLKKKDKKLAAAIDKIGKIERATNDDLFSSLINSIVGQQISTKAQKTIWKRMQNGLLLITPKTILDKSDEQLQSFGLSYKKVSYIKNVAQNVNDGRLSIDSLYNLSDDEVLKELIKLGGVGIWTAEMIMLFSMQRPDILSFGDLAILRGMRMLYHHRKLTKELFTKYRKRYSPYGSVASLYLWEIAGGAIPEMRDYASKKKK